MKGKIIGWVALGAVIGLFAGLLVGRWLLPNNGPCTIDYVVASACVGAVTGVGLLVVGTLGTRYALQTARIAAETLKIESDPLLLAEADSYNSSDKPNFAFAVRVLENRLQPGPVSGDFKGIALRLRIRNIGRRPAFNVKANIEIRDALGNYAKLDQMFFVQGLLPNESAVVSIHNDSATALVVTVTGATIGSVSKPGNDISAIIFLSSAFPMPIG